ncbi:MULTISPECIES: winged helix-turn-helix domain-containing protein [Halorussus]|uniref:helix-turn-helix transcriptional regulator n=1 Tax=Halorussus TaxID=1070314 RepID=UPI000E20D67F|nr:MULTISPECIES: winged helix-turn-helix transcriptional regulator [Halorussus]NHN60875.1 winged helix-turn-helix transcriptional regulator [Halorussus sp. JP-T4]
MEGGIEDIEFLARSATRVQLMDALRREGELSKRELRERMDASRTTVQRNLEALEDRGWVRNSNRAYSLATCGELIAREFTGLRDTVSATERLQPVLKWLDRSELDLDLRLLSEADIVTASEGDPWAMVNRHVKRLREAESVRAILPLTGLHAMEVTRDRVLDDGARVEFIGTSNVVDTLQASSDYRKIYDDLMKSERFDLYSTDEETLYYLGILDEIVQIGVDEDGEPRALLETTDSDVHGWARDSYEAHLTRAQPVVVD